MTLKDLPKDLVDAFVEILNFDITSPPKDLTLARLIWIACSSVGILTFSLHQIDEKRPLLATFIILILWAIFTKIQCQNQRKSKASKTLLQRLMLVTLWIATMSLLLTGTSLFGISPSLARLISFAICVMLLLVQTRKLIAKKTKTYFFSIVVTLLAYLIIIF